MAKSDQKGRKTVLRSTLARKVAEAVREERRKILSSPAEAPASVRPLGCEEAVSLSLGVVSTSLTVEEAVALAERLSGAARLMLGVVGFWRAGPGDEIRGIVLGSHVIKLSRPTVAVRRRSGEEYEAKEGEVMLVRRYHQTFPIFDGLSIGSEVIAKCLKYRDIGHGRKLKEFSVLVKGGPSHGTE